MHVALFSPPGIALASFLHTVGAIGYLGGITLFVAWARGMHRGHHNGPVLGLAAALTYVSIFLNLSGGFLRTYQPGHPSLTAVFEEPWVAVMAIKHLALFAGIFAAVWLFEMDAPRMLRAMRKGTLGTLSMHRPRAMTAIVVSSIIVAAVLGGVSTVVPIGEAADVPDDEDVVHPPPEDGGSAGPYHFEGQVTSQAGTASGTFDVPAGTGNITAVFAVEPPAGPVAPGQFTLTLRDPTGAASDEQTPMDPSQPRRTTLEVAEPFPGTWTYEVQGDVAVSATWTLDITLS